MVYQHRENGGLGWVKWKIVYQHRENVGLGLKDVRVVKLILLVKWRWMLLQSDQPTWKEVLVEKYRREVDRLLEGSEVTWTLVCIYMVEGGSVFTRGCWI